MARSGLTTIRRCLEPDCRHGASAHKLRQVDYALCRAECEHCACTGYLDPGVTEANRYGDDGKPIPAEVHLPVSRSVIRRVRFEKSKEERRSYWRQKQRESRERRKKEVLLNDQSVY